MAIAPIKVDALDRYFGDVRAVSNISFNVQEGEVFGFLGPNGAGKTTTIRVLMGLLKPTSGKATVFGLDCWKDSATVNGKVGFLPGNLQLYPKMTGREFLEYFSAYRGSGEKERRNMLAERFELNMDRKISQLSKGNQQKIGIVQALMHDAPLLILDEPTGGLDPLKQNDFLELILEEQSRGKTIFLSSHLLNEVERVASRVGIIRQGEIVAIEDINSLRQNRSREMQLVLQEPASLEPLLNLDGIQLLHTEPDGLTMKLAIRGQIQPVIQALATMPVEDIVYGPPDLESVFMHYYEGTGDDIAERERELEVTAL